MVINTFKLDLTFQQQPHKKISVLGHSIHYLDYNGPKANPQAETLILLHGIGASAERWLRVIPTLSKFYRVIVPDIIGFGHSDKPTVEYTHEFFVKFLREFMNALKVERTNLMGSSFGGFIITEFAFKFEDLVKKMVLVSPAGPMRTSTRVLDEYILAALYPTYENVSNAYRDMAFDPNTVTEGMIVDFMNRMALPNAKYTFMSTLLGIKNAPRIDDKLDKINIPTLVIWGENDYLIPVTFAKAYHRIINSKLVVMERTGHTPFTEQPDIFCNHVLNFLSNINSII